MKKAFAFIIAALLLITGATAVAETMVCTVPDGQYVNVRNRADSKAATWGKMRLGDTLEVEEISAGWVKFQFEGHAAYVMTKYFETNEDSDYTVIGNGRVRVRNKPAGERIDWAEVGSTVHVDAWQYDKDGTKWGRIGCNFISADFLQEQEESK